MLELPNVIESGGFLDDLPQFLRGELVSLQLVKIILIVP